MSDSIEVMGLKEVLGFPLYACSKETIKLYKPYLDAVDLTYTQYIAMVILWERKSLTVKELGSHLYLDSGTLTPLLKRLEAKGLITRRRAEMDERNLIVTVTEAGEELKQQVLAIPEKVSPSTGLEPEEKVELNRLLNKLLNQLTLEDD